MDLLRDAWNRLDDPLLTLAGVVVIVVGAMIVKRILVRILRRAYLGRSRPETLVSLLESLVRYVVYGAAFVIIIGLVTGGRASAFFGASVVAVVIGFAFQRLLADVIAGALLLFEGQYAVGDTITVHSYDITGVVEEFTLRTTSLRTTDGHRMTVMNGSIQAFTFISPGG